MSAQTGDVAPSGPVSQRLVDRARFRVDRLQKEPNPIWIRELTSLDVSEPETHFNLQLACRAWTTLQALRD